MENRIRLCPQCGGRRVKPVCVFDFKGRLECPDCGYYTRWHLQDWGLALKEWNEEAEKNGREYA